MGIHHGFGHMTPIIQKTWSRAALLGSQASWRSAQSEQPGPQAARRGDLPAVLHCIIGPLLFLQPRATRRAWSVAKPPSPTPIDRGVPCIRMTTDGS